MNSIPPHLYWINGSFVERSSASIRVNDLAFSRGYAAFEALRTYRRIPFLLDAHLTRLETTCGHLGLAIPGGRQATKAAVTDTIAANDFADCLVRIYVTGGEAPGFVPAGNEQLLVLVDPLREYPERQYKEGVTLMTSRLHRSIPGAKSIDYVAGVSETIRARAQGSDEVVFLDGEGNLLEGTTFNIAVLRKMEIVAPLEGVLDGITMGHLIGLLEAAGWSVRRTPFSLQDAAESDEIIITSSTREVMPVARIDGRSVGRDSSRYLARDFRERFRESAFNLCSK